MRVSVRVAAIVSVLWLIGGCNQPRWLLTYEQAERDARHREAPVLILYADHLDAKSSQLEELLSTKELSRFVTCKLVDSFHPNRRFVAQYRVDRAPALVVVHTDGSYHSMTDGFSVESVRWFLDSANPPGLPPTSNPQVARPIDYHWEPYFESAQRKAQRQSRKLLVVYKWWLSPESTELLSRMSRPEVVSLFTETVNCLLDWDYVPNRTVVARYGVREVPAMIIVDVDGTARTLQGLRPVDEIIRFAASAGLRRRTRDARSTAVPTIPRWVTDYAQASGRARQERRPLLVFFHSENSPDSARAAELLDLPSVVQALSGWVTCRLDARAPDRREIAARFRVGDAPAVVALLPDGAFHTRGGIMRLDELLSFLAQMTTQPSSAQP